MHPFYHIGLRNSLPSLAEIAPLITDRSFNSMTTVTETLDLRLIRAELAAMGIESGEIKIWSWQFQDYLAHPIHTDGQRQSCINWRLTPNSVLDVFDREGAETVKVQTTAERWSTHWLYPGLAEPPLRATWNSYGPVLFDPQQPHRVRRLAANQTERITVTLTLHHSYERAWALFKAQDRIRDSRQ